MKTMIAGATVVAFLWAGAASAQAPNLSGTWILNPEKSHWGSMQQPLSVIVQIEHKEPALQYCGTVTYANEDVREFCFAGAIDGTRYPVERSFGRGTMTTKRLDTFSVLSTYTSDDGLFSETTLTTVSPDGKRLTRRMRLKSPVGTRTWTEEYERR